MSNSLRDKIDEAMGEKGRVTVDELEENLEDLGVQVCFFREGELLDEIRDMDPVDGEGFSIDVYHGRRIIERVHYGIA